VICPLLVALALGATMGDGLKELPQAYCALVTRTACRLYWETSVAGLWYTVCRGFEVVGHTL